MTDRQYRYRVPQLDSIVPYDHDYQPSIKICMVCKKGSANFMNVSHDEFMTIRELLTKKG